MEEEDDAGLVQRVASEMIAAHGEKAPSVATALEQACREKGHHGDAAVWRTIAQAIVEMLRAENPDPS